MSSRNANQQPQKSDTERALERAKVLLSAAQAEMKRSQELLNRKSTSPHNFQKRIRKVKAANQRIQNVMEAVSEFEAALGSEVLERLNQAAKEAPVELQVTRVVDTVEEGTESASV